MSQKNKITVDGNGNITIQDVDNSTITMDTSNAEEARAQLERLSDSVLDSLAQIVDEQQNMSEAFKALLSGLLTQKNIVKGSITNVQGNVEIGDRTYNSYNWTIIHQVPFGAVVYNKDPQRKYLSFREPKLLNVFFDRKKQIEEIREYFLSGASVVVIYGREGRGKSALAGIYYHHFEDEYEQLAWVDYRLNICKSITLALGSHSVEEEGRKTDSLYTKLAFSEVNYLKNYLCKRLIVINNVTDWKDIEEHLDLFNLQGTHFLITSPASCPEEMQENFALKIENFPIPSINESILREIFDHYAQSQLPVEIINKVKHNLYLLDLILRQVSSQNPKDIHDYYKSIFSGLDKSLTEEVAIITNVLDYAHLSDAETWMLLQMAALPIANYDVEDLSTFICSDYEEAISDITALKGFQIFQQDMAGICADSYQLEDITAGLIRKGWLVEMEDDQFRIHSLLQRALQHKVSIRVSYFYELSEILNNSFFAEVYDLIVDDIKYEQHLRAFLSFIPPQAHELYLQNLEKLIALVKRNGHYYDELELRTQHLNLLETHISPHSVRFVNALIEVADCNRRCGKFEEALAYAEKALDIGRGLSNYNIRGCYTIKGLLLRDLGDYEGAKGLLEKAYSIVLTRLGVDHPNTKIVKENLDSVRKMIE